VDRFASIWFACWRRQYRADLERGAGHVELPGALAAKYPDVSREMAWQWVFPAARICFHPEIRQRRRQ